MSRKSPHVLTITHKSGRITQHTHKDLRTAQMFLGMALLDNGYVKTKREAQTIANIQAGQTLELDGVIATITEQGK